MLQENDCPSVLNQEITPSVVEITESDNTAVARNRKKLYAHYVTTIVQTLEDICINVAHPEVMQHS